MAPNIPLPNLEARVAPILRHIGVSTPDELRAKYPGQDDETILGKFSPADSETLQPWLEGGIIAFIKDDSIEAETLPGSQITRDRHQTKFLTACTIMGFTPIRLHGNSEIPEKIRSHLGEINFDESTVYSVTTERGVGIVEMFDERSIRALVAYNGGGMSDSSYRLDFGCAMSCLQKLMS